MFFFFFFETKKEKETEREKGKAREREKARELGLESLAERYLVDKCTKKKKKGRYHLYARRVR